MNGSYDTVVLNVLHVLIGDQDFLQGKGLVARLAKKTAIDPIQVKLALANLAKNSLLEGVSDRGEVFGRVRLLVERPCAPDPDSLVRWRAAMAAAALLPADQQALEPCHEKFTDWQDDDLSHVVQGLTRLRANQHEERSRPRFLVSARYLLGSSKLLGNLPAASLRSFGIDPDAFSDSPPQIIVAGPAMPAAVVLIENPHAFESAIAAGAAEEAALIVTYGYGLSKASQAFGYGLVEALNNPDAVITLVRQGTPPPAAALLRHPRSFFWGDLDLEGLRIFETLQSALPGLCLPCIYLEMMACLRQRTTSHPYCDAVQKVGQRPPRGSDPCVALLAKLCSGRSVDQEAVCPVRDVASLTNAMKIADFSTRGDAWSLATTVNGAVNSRVISEI